MNGKSDDECVGSIRNAEDCLSHVAPEAGEGFTGSFMGDEGEPHFLFPGHCAGSL